MNILKKILPLFSSFFVATGVFLLVWMMFFDVNDFVSQYRLINKASDLEDEKQYYLNKIEEVKKDRKELMSTRQLLEKFAREKYIMKKPTEDVYIFKDE